MRKSDSKEQPHHAGARTFCAALSRSKILYFNDDVLTTEKEAFDLFSDASDEAWPSSR